MPRPLRRAISAGLTAALALGAVVAFGAVPASAATVVENGSLDASDPTWSRSCTTGTGQSFGDGFYDVSRFQVSETGTYSMDTAATGGTNADPYQYLFLASDFPAGFDPATPATCLQSDDDGGDGLNSRIVTTLEAGVSYLLVTTTYGQAFEGQPPFTMTYQRTYDGPGDILVALPPTATVSADAATVETLPVDVDVVFSEPVVGFDATDVVLAGTAGPAGASVAGSGASYVVSVADVAGAGTIEITIPAAAAASASSGLPSTAASITLEYVVRPTVTVSQADGQADPTDALPVEFEVQFSDFVTGLEPADVILSGTAGSTTVELVALDAPPTVDPEPTEEPTEEPTAPPTIVPAAEGEPLDPGTSASRYLVRVLDAAQAGTIEVAIAEGAATTDDGALSLASTSEDATVTYLVAAPSPTVTAPAPTTSVPSAPAPTTAPSAGELPQTGGSPLWIALLLAGALVAAGVGVRRVARTR